MKIRKFHVKPNLPKKLMPLMDIALNMWHSWNWEAIQLFLRLDEKLWVETGRNAAALLGLISQDRLDELASDESFIAELNEVHQKLQWYLSRPVWFDKAHPSRPKGCIAYFSCEYGINDTLPIYSGGLGVLSGDHLKSSSDLGVPLVAVGLLYRHGYLRQYLNIDGWQQERYPENDWSRMPVAPVRDETGGTVKITVELCGEPVHLRIWRVSVGRVPLYLLCANLEENSPEHRKITDQLYGGDREMRIQQEILLGIGGVRALRALGEEPVVYHINEGHSAFLVFERLRGLMHEKGLSRNEALEVVRSSTVFTTHTPVPAGNEVFDTELVRKYFQRYAQELGISWDDFLALGKTKGEPPECDFCMTALALRCSAHCNGVSNLHGEVSREMWRNVWPGMQADDIPIASITNGIHTHTWISHDMRDLFERYLGPKFVDEPGELGIWEKVDQIPDVEFWRNHQRRRERLVFFARKRLQEQLKHRGASQPELRAAISTLNPGALTIGFARRFASYKRGTLLFKDLNRLARILSDINRPVQIIFAGLAHPQDTKGKELIRDIIHYSQDPAISRNIVFIEDYDMNVARYLVQGVDVWLNTPRRPLEASGTSGMKAAANGALNLSILDGWWAEAYAPEVGWAIGSGESYSDLDEQDYIESQALYNLLEHDVIPLFYERDSSGLPTGWIEKVKASLRKIASYFNTDRMVMEYTKRFYLPAAEQHDRLRVDNYARARQLTGWLDKLSCNWGEIKVVSLATPDGAQTSVAHDYPVEATVSLGGMNPEDVWVELYFGKLNGDGKIIDPGTRAMFPVDGGENGTHVFRAGIPCRHSGNIGFAVRIRPRNPELSRQYIPGLIVWE